ncbi:MAG: protein tyrosine phosphatase [Alphaproteobacteria bacterium HGW-Alphaproteobacteria-5]|jgi:protein-tyrosine phosphatase|nr:MAG: protein tyrosine phosphatase [Alphaproteobacteria bacterium HGW-Alphaproteobacteria-5]
MKTSRLFLPLLLLVGSASAQPVWAEAAPAATAVALPAAAFPNAPNLRDIGGYETADGGKVRLGLVYRSDQIDRLSDAEVLRLAALGIATVVDLRTATERSREPDRLPPDANYVVADVMADAPPGVGGDMLATLTRMIAAGGAVPRMEEANRAFVSSPAARQAYSRLLRQVLAADGQPLLFHCTAGKDRTGWGAALLLTIAGVPQEEVFQDYLASTERLAGKNMQTIASLGEYDLDARQRMELEALLTVRSSFLAAAFAEVEHRYGTFDRYLQDGLALTPEEVERLRHLLVTPDDA